MIQEDFLANYGLTQHALAKELRIPHSRVSVIIKGRRGITADAALRVSRELAQKDLYKQPAHAR